MSKKQDKKVKEENIKKLKEEIQLYSELKEEEATSIINRILYKQVLIKTLRNILIVNIILIIIAIIIMSFISGGNILKFSPEHFSTFYLVFLLLIFDSGLGFIFSGFNKKIAKNYKKKSINIGIKIIILSVMLLILCFI